MSEEFDRFLASGPETIKERDRIAQEARDRVAAEEDEKLERRKVLVAQWRSCRSALQGVIDRINLAFKDVNLELMFMDEREGPPGVAELSIGVRRIYHSIGNSVHLNVTGTGAQHVIFHYASDTPKPSNKMLLPDIDQCGGEQYAQMLMSFLQPLLHRL